MNSYHPQSKTDKLIDYSIIMVLSLAIGAVAGLLGLKFLTWVLNQDGS